ncbi:MAG TPA: MFS transporter, partial [Acidimicrobiales bacterium]
MTIRQRLGKASRETFRSLRVRNFRLFFTGQIISQVGNWLTLVAQTLLVLKLTGNGFDVGLLTACQFGPVLLLGAWAGVIADRSDKRRLLLITQALAMVQSFALAALAFMPDPPVPALYAIAFAGGIVIAFDNPARRAFVVEMVPEPQVPNAVSLNSALMTASRIVGPALAGLLIATVGYGWCFFTDGLSYVAVLTALVMMRPGELRRPPLTARAKGQVREGLRYIKTMPDLWIPLVMMAVIGTLSFNFQVVLPLLVTRTFD